MGEHPRRPDARVGAASVGIGWRAELAADLLQARASVDFVEVVAETCFAQPAARREARAIAEVWPVVPHGVKLSLGSAGGVDSGRARQLGALARELRAPAVSEHVAFTRAGGREIGHLTTLPFTREAVRVVARNVAAVRRFLPDVPLLLENVAWSFRWPEDELSEGEFYCAVAEATGCDLLLDVANLYANAFNSGLAPAALLSQHPLDRVRIVHLAGGTVAEGFYEDTHAHPVPDAVFDLLGRLIEAVGPVPVILERDAGFPPFAHLCRELERTRALLHGAAFRARPPVFQARAATDAAAADAEDLAGRQAALAEMLTRVDAPHPAATAPFGEQAIARTRAILESKRVDDALPLLERTSRCGDLVRDVALEAVRGTPRAPRGAGIADALRIAEAAAADPRLAPSACIDRLELRTRFDRHNRPRLSPYLAREDLPDGRRVWAMKGPGRGAPVRLYQTRGGEP